MTGGFDLVVVGSGFGGSLLAMIARRLGLSVALVERGRHPRFAIGESTSPLANLLLEELAERYDLPRLKPLTSYGPWQRTYPEVVCGLKRGFTFYHHRPGRPFGRDPERVDQLMVAASPCDEVADTHWLRSDVDWFFVQKAVATGVEYLDETGLSGAERITGWTLTGDRKGQPVKLTARLLVDATGPRGFLSRALGIADAGFAGYPPTQTLYSHFVGVRRCEELPPFGVDGEPPYPPDDAALHHVFDGGWMWVLRFGNGVTSAGFALEERLAQEVGAADGPAAWDRLLARYPSIGEHLRGAEPIRPFTYAPRLVYRAARAAGEGWAMLPSAAAFVDPLLSTGMPLTLLGIERLARLLEYATIDSRLDRGLEEYGEATLSDADWTAAYIAACYAGMKDFPTFAALTLFYFAAASYSEMARRLRRQPAPRFLASDRADFAPAMVRCRSHVLAGCGLSTHDVAGAIEPLNVTGLADESKRNWYPVDLQDVVRNADKLGFTREEMTGILAAAPWAQTTVNA